MAAEPEDTPQVPGPQPDGVGGAGRHRRNADPHEGRKREQAPAAGDGVHEPRGHGGGEDHPVLPRRHRGHNRKEHPLTLPRGRPSLPNLCLGSLDAWGAFPDTERQGRGDTTPARQEDTTVAETPSTLWPAEHPSAGENGPGFAWGPPVTPPAPPTEPP